MTLVHYISFIFCVLLLSACDAGQASTSDPQAHDTGASDVALRDAPDTSPRDAGSEAPVADAPDSLDADAGLGPDTESDTDLDTADAPPDSADTAPGGPFVVWMSPSGDDTHSGRRRSTDCTPSMWRICPTAT